MTFWLFIGPLLLIVGGALLVMLVDAFTEKESPDLATVSAVTLGLAGMVSFFGLLQPGTLEEVPAPLSLYLATDSMSLFFDVMLGLGGALSALMAGAYLREHRMERGEFYVLILLSAFGAMILARAIDMLSLFIGLETMSLGVYSMAAFRRSSPRAVEGAVKYFLLGSFAAALLLFGASLLYAATGHTDFAGIGEVIAAGEADTKLTLFGMVLVIVGLAFKVGAVPFHMWTPDVYQGAATPATAFMSVAVKASAFAVLVRVVMTAFGSEVMTSESAGWPPILTVIAIITMLYGNVAAIQQTNVKRMLAYSSIAHAGYLLVGVLAAAKIGADAVSAIFFYLLAYTVSNGLAFGSLIWAGSYGKEAVSYEDLAGLGRRHPIVGMAFTVGVLSLMGFPPTAGFFGKYYVFSSAVQADMVGLAIFGVLTSAVGAYYYLKVIVFLFMKQPAEGAPVAVPMKTGYLPAALSIAALFVAYLGLLPGNVLEVAVTAARQLVGV